MSRITGRQLFTRASPLPWRWPTSAQHCRKVLITFVISVPVVDLTQRRALLFIKEKKKELATQCSSSSTRFRWLNRSRRHQAKQQLTLARQRGVLSRLTTRQTLQCFRCCLGRNHIGRSPSRQQFSGRYTPRLSQRPSRIRLKCKRFWMTARRARLTL